MITFPTSSSEEFTVYRKVCFWNRLAIRKCFWNLILIYIYLGLYNIFWIYKYKDKQESLVSPILIFLWLLIPIPPSFSPICSSKSVKYSSYGMTPYIVSSYQDSPKANLFVRLFTWCSQSKITSYVSMNTPTNTF